jgi:hypothetical protein
LVNWTENVDLERGGLRLVGSDTLIPWQQIQSAQINERTGNIEVHERDVHWPIVKLPNHEINGRPGMLVVQARAALTLTA